MVCRYGMSNAFGFQSFVEPNAFAVSEAPPAFSQKTAEAIDAEVKRLVDEGYARAKKMLEENRDKLELLANTLLDQETITWNDKVYMWWHPDDGYMIENFSALDESLVQTPPLSKVV